jgi:hypothetical protein
MNAEVHPDRTPEHEKCERLAAVAGFAYPERIRTLLVTIGDIRYRIFDAIFSWHVEDDILCCGRCRQPLSVIGPNMLHALPLARCQCRASFMEPLDDRDRGLLELAHPVSEEDAKLGDRFHRELSRLAATVSPKLDTR